MTFNQWADGIGVHVSSSIPDVHVKRTVDDFYRWISQGKECHLHALSDSTAALLMLKRDGALTNCWSSCRVSIGGPSQQEVARRIIGWFAR